MHTENIVDTSTPRPNPGAPDPSAGLGAAAPALAQAREEAAAAERQRLAQTLHDTLAQSLTAIYFVAKGIEIKLQRDGSDVAGKMTSLADMIHQASNEVLACMRELETGRPPPSGREGCLEGAASERPAAR